MVVVNELATLNAGLYGLKNTKNINGLKHHHKLYF